MPHFSSAAEAGCRRRSGRKPTARQGSLPATGTATCSCSELGATEGGIQLVLTLRLPSGEDIAKACAGFDAHLEMLAAALEGVPIRFPVDFFLTLARLISNYRASRCYRPHSTPRD